MGSLISTFRNMTFCFHKKMKKSCPDYVRWGVQKNIDFLFNFSSLNIDVAAKEESNDANCIAGMGQELC